MSSKTQISSSHTGVGDFPVPTPIVPRPPIAFPPAHVASPASVSVHVFYFEISSLFPKLATLAVPFPGETSEQMGTRYNTLYLAQMCALKGFFDPPAPFIPHPIMPDPVQVLPMDGANVPTPEPGNPPIRPFPPVTPVDPVVGGEPFAALLQYVQSTGNLNGVASLFLTLWNDAGLRKDSAQTAQATQIWQTAVSATPASDVPEVIFYDHAVKQMFRLPASVLSTLSANTAVSGRWAKGETFRKELSALATTTYTDPFPATALAAPVTPIGGRMSPMVDTATDWFKASLTVLGSVGSSGVMINSMEKACWFSGICYVAAAGANAATATQVLNNFFADPGESRYAQIVATTMPADTPVEITSGSIGYISGPDPNQAYSNSPSGPISDGGPDEPGPPSLAPPPGSPEEDGSQAGEGGTSRAPGYVRRHRPAEPKPVAQ